ncbi:hypothetical protein V8F20_001856 [Naviculisporaceae sp. PSN 640]
MKFTSITTSLLSLASMASMVSAERYFWIYWSQDSVSGTGAYMYYFFDNHPSCNDVFNTRGVMEQDDLNDGQEGAVCEGNGCWNGKPEEITRFEFNAPNYGHYNILKIDGWGYVLRDMGGNNVGICRPTREDDFTCGAPFAQSGVSIFQCGFP